ncbi:MAG: hypothetical protein R3D55_07085 [Chloroflexota bacterium]
MSIITTLVLILMFLTPTVSVLAVMLQPADRRRGPATIGIMLLFAIGIHLLGARGLINNFLNLSSSSALIATIISTIVTLLLGGALGLLLQDLRTNKS